MLGTSQYKDGEYLLIFLGKIYLSIDAMYQLDQIHPPMMDIFNPLLVLPKEQT